MSESIYELIPTKVAKPAKPPLYRSKHDPKTPPTATSFGYGTKTATGEANRGGERTLKAKHISPGATLGRKPGEMGRAKLTVTSKAPLPEPKKFTYGDRRKAPVEKTSAVRRGPPKTSKNFVKENKAKSAAEAAARRKAAEDELDYTQKADYGKTPAYLEKVKQVVEEEKELVRRMVEGQQQREEEAAGPRVRLMEDSEREELLAQLKSKWNEVNRGYQQMTHLVTLDTLSKVKKKESYEAQLAELEKAMDKLSKQHVFVADE